MATPTVEETAVRLHVSTSALRRYRSGSRKVTIDLMIRLAAVLRAQALALVDIANQLEAATRKDGQDA